MVGLHANCIRIGTKNFWIGNTTCSKRPGRIMPNKCILEDRRVAITQRLRYFYAVFSSAAFFADGHRTIYQEHIQTLDLIDLALDWHEILHAWNERAAHSRRWRVSPEFAVVRIGNWRLKKKTGGSHCQTSHSSLD